jgi:hypothetical protein
MPYRNPRRVAPCRAATTAIAAASNSVIESLEGRALMSASVTSFTLIDAASDREIMTLSPGATVNLATLPSRQLNVRANVNGETSNVQFSVDGVKGRHESVAPFALVGDSKGDYNAWTPFTGTHTVAATAFAGDVAGGSLAVSFNVIDQVATSPTPTPTPPPTEQQPSGTDAPSVTRFVLVNADTDRDLYTLTDGATIDLSQLPTNHLTVRVDVDGVVSSVRFSQDSVANFNTEKSAPFALNGDRKGDMRAWTLTAGQHTIKAVAYNGTQQGGLQTVNFNIVDRGTPSPTPTPTPTPTPAPTPTPTPAPTPAPTPTPTPAPTPTPTPPPTNGAKPGPDNTGPSNASILRKVSGDMTITQDGAVIENVDVDGDINVKASNVTIRNFRAKGIKFYDEPKYGSFRNLLVEDGEVSDPSGGTGIIGGHMTVRRVEVHHMGADAFNVHAYAVIEDCYVHHLGMLDGSHADALSGSSPDGKPVLGVVVRNNNFDIPSSVDHGQTGARPDYNGYRSNGVIFVGLFGTMDDPMIVEGNWLNGGNYTVNSGIDGAVIVYRNNRFGHDFNWGLRKTHSGETWEPGTWVGNVWDDTGLPV